MKMYLRSRRTLGVLLASLALLPGIAFAQKLVMFDGKERPLYREGQVIVKYKSGAIRTRNTMDAMYKRMSVLDVRRIGVASKNMEQLVFDPTHLTVEQAVETLERDPTVEYVQPNYMVYAFDDIEAIKPKGEPCVIPGIPFPPGCEDGDGGEEPPPGDQPCIIPGIPYPPGCKDDGGGGGWPGNPGQPKEQPPVQDVPAEVSPPQADPNLSQAYGIEKVGAVKAWEINRGSKDIVVAVIDTGIDYNHNDLSFNVWRNPKAATYLQSGIDSGGGDVTGDVVGYDFFYNDPLPFDDHGHGTHCAGTIGAVGGNGVGVSGVSQRVSIMGVKFLDANGSGDTANAIKSIDYAVSRGAKVLSNSWGGPGDANNNALRESIKRAAAANVLFIAAAGNDGTDNDSRAVYPASFNEDNMINVAATNNTDGLAYFSNRGVKTVHVGAPGVDVYSLAPGNGYAKMSGTSMACPHVAGVAALVWAQFPNETYKQIKRRILQSGDSVPALAGKTVTGKRVNVFNALKSTLTED